MFLGSLRGQWEKLQVNNVPYISEMVISLETTVCRCDRSRSKYLGITGRRSVDDRRGVV